MKSCVFMGENDEYVISGSDDFRLYIWDVPSSEEVGECYLDSNKSATVEELTVTWLQLSSVLTVVAKTWSNWIRK
jgi:WD40 repeat protein